MVSNLMDFESLFNTIILLEANTEKRIEYLQNKYGKILDDLLEARFADKNIGPDRQETWNFKAIYGKTPVEFMVTMVDPTGGEYSEWILKNFIKGIGSFGSMGDTRQIWRFFTEDFFKVYEDLQKYHKYKKLFKKASVDMNNPETAKLADINRINGFDDLYDKLRIIDYYIQEQEEQEQLAKAEKEVDKIYTSENYFVIIPETEEASCAYGRGTRWCTASTGSYNRFNYYNRQGPLYIIINRKTQDKFQFHFESEQYMNADDSQVNLKNFFSENSELQSLFLDLAISRKEWDFVEKMGVTPDAISEKMDSLDEDSRKDVVSKFPAIAFLYGLKNPEFVNSHQKLMVFEKDGTITLVTPYSEFSDLAMFLDNGRGNSKYYESVLAGDEEFWGVADWMTYEDDYLDWLDESNSRDLIKLTYNVTGQKAENVQECMEILEMEDDYHYEEVKRWLTISYSDTYEYAYKDAFQSYLIKKIGEVLGDTFKWNSEDKITFTGWDKNKFKTEIIEYIQNNPMQDNANFPSYSDFFRDFASILGNEGDLPTPRDDVNPDLDPSDGDQKEAFNSRFSEEFEMPDPVNDQLELDLELDESSVNKSMLQFDLYVKKILSEDLGNRGPAVKAQAPQTMGASSTPQASASPTPQQGSAPASPQPTSGVQNQQNQQNQQPDYLSIFSNPESVQQFSSDPNNIQGFKTFLSDPKNVQTLTSQIKDPNVLTSMIGLLSK